MATDTEIADALIDRLNSLVADPHVREDVGRLIEARVPCSEASDVHPSIQTQDGHLGFLGLMNGLAGTIPDGRLRGWGYIAAVFGDDGKLERFRRTDSK